MRGGSSFLLYLLVIGTLGVTLRVWWGVRRLGELVSSEELRPIRQELRELRSELEEINRVALKQQATLYKIEAMLDLEGEKRARETAAGITTSAGGTVTEATEEPPPPPQIDDQAVQALVRTQEIRAAAGGVEHESRGRASVATGERTVTISSDDVGRSTVVFKSKRAVRESSHQALTEEQRRTDVGPAVPGGLTLEDLAALVSTVSEHAVTGAAPAPQQGREPSGELGKSEPRETVERADPTLPGATPVDTSIARAVSESGVPPGTSGQNLAGGGVAKLEKEVGPRRVTTVPALTGEERPAVPPIRASRVVRERRAQEADITSSLLLSEQFVPAPERPGRVTISDILAAEDRE